MLKKFFGFTLFSFLSMSVSSCVTMPEHPFPDIFKFGMWRPGGWTASLLWDGKKLIAVRKLETGYAESSQKNEKEFSPSVEKWDRFWRNSVVQESFGWNGDYQPSSTPLETDPSKWMLTITRENASVKASGTYIFAGDRLPLQDSRTYSEFCVAIRELIEEDFCLRS
ncbi:MAG: hypothetical protein EOP04_07550 [Proteobacteria bacterium]|nr:MAG: hypothetical protein EOP04_07550 [Pseudomonadota bacterium]